MLVKITTYNNTVYKFASKTTDTTDGIYLGRLRDDLSLTSMASASGTVPASQNLTIYNADNYIPKSENFWGASLLLTQENGLTWLGKVTFFNFDSDGNLYLTASEKGAPELELQLPDEVRQVYTIDDNFHQSSVTMTIPLVIGGTHSNPITLSTILIDKTRGIYLICTGEIREIVTVYNGTEALPRSAYIPYKGWSTQAEHPGFAYIQLEEPYRYNSDGSYAEINVDVVGLKLGEHTEAECRNGARFLLWFLKTASSGINGWGCGIPESEIDVASFNSAISLVDLMGLKLDGIMWLRQSAQNWIDQICQAIHGSYSIGSNGKRKLTIDYAGAASKKTFNASKIILNKYGKDSYVSTVYNKGILSYGYNHITGLFMQSAQFENADSIAQIGEQKFVGESYLIQDASTALAILEYNCKKSLSSAEAIDFTTDDLTTDLFAGDIITLDRSDIGITGEFQITSISTSDTKSEITAVRFDRSVFTVTGSHSNVNWGNEKNITPALTPAQATNLLLSTGFDINQDGTGNSYISGTFTVPEGGWLAAAVQYGIGANPTNYTELALITEGRFKIQPVNVGTIYTIRVRMITATGHSDYITGQITSTGDTVPPDIPTIVLNSTEKSVIVKCAIDNPPSDMGGFQIWRKKHTEEVFTLVGNVAANFGYASFPDHVETFVEYDYKAKSYDRSGNLSDFSQVVSITPTGLEATELAATAIKIPTGSILNINAKGSTTESIKTANGVIDGSGFGRHGQAYGGVSIISDVAKGLVFHSDGATNSWIKLTDNVQLSEQITIIIDVKMLGSTTNKILIDLRNSANNDGISVGRNTNGRFQILSRTSENSWDLYTPNNTAKIGEWQTVGAVFGAEGSKIYVGGELIAENNKVNTSTSSLPCYLLRYNANTSYNADAEIANVRIYQRELSNVEIKSIAMIPQESIFHRINSDLIGANVINSIHINSDAVTSDKIGAGEVKANNIDSNAVTTDKLAANAVTADKITVLGSRVPSLIFQLSAQGLSQYAANDVVPDISGNNNTFRFGGTWAGVLRTTQYGWMFDGRNTSPKTITNLKTITVASSGWTFFLRFYVNAAPTDYAYLLDFSNASSNNNNRFILRVNSDLKIVMFSYTSAGSVSAESGGIQLATGKWYSACVRCPNTTTLRLRVCEHGTNNWQDVHFTVAARSTATVSPAGMKFAVQRAGTNYSLNGGLANMQFYNRSITDAELYYLHKTATDTESGQITADRVATDALKSRNYEPDANTDAGLAFTTNGSFFNLAKGTLAMPFIRVGCDSSNVYDCQIGNFKIDSAGGFIGQPVSSASDAYIKVAYSSYTAELRRHGLYFTYKPTGHTTETYVVDGGLYSAYDGTTILSLAHTGQTARMELGGASPVYINTSVDYSTSNPQANTVCVLKGAVFAKYGVTTTSDETEKKNIRNVSALNKLKQLPVKKYKYSTKSIDEHIWKSDFEYRKIHQGEIKAGTENEVITWDINEKMPIFKEIKNTPDFISTMAADFNKAFNLGEDTTAVNYTNMIGVCMRAIQELSQQVDDLKRQVRSYKRILNISDQQIAEERNARAVRLLEVTKARQAKRELAILARNSEIENSVIEPILEVEKLANNSESSKNHDY